MEEKKKKHMPIWAIMLISGIVILIIGLILMSIFGIKKSYDTVDINESFDCTNVDDLYIEAGIGKAEIVSYEGSEIKVEGENVPENRYKLKVEGNKFIIKYKSPKWYEWYQFGTFNIFGFNNQYEDTTFTVYLPEKVYRNIELNIGIGEMNVSGLNFVDGDFNAGTGEAYFSDCISTGELEINSGVGELDLNNCDFADVEVQGGTGTFKYSGKISKSLDIDAGVGEIDIYIDGNYSDYSFNKTQGIGDFDVDRGSEGERENTGDLIPVDIDQGIGSVKLSFK